MLNSDDDYVIFLHKAQIPTDMCTKPAFRYHVCKTVVEPERALKAFKCQVQAIQNL